MADQPSARDWLKQHLADPKAEFKGTLRYRQLYRVLLQGEYYLSGRVYRRDPKAVSSLSIDVQLDSDLPQSYNPVLDRLQEEVIDLVIKYNGQFLRELISEKAYHESDKAVIEALDDGAFYFDEVGDTVDASQFKTLEMLPPPLAQKILGEYAEMFNRTPDEVYQALTRRKARFDKRGNRIDTSHLKTVSQLPDNLKARVVEKYRHWCTQDDSWAETLENEWKDRLEAAGFKRVQFGWKLEGTLQNSGASFTSDAVDGVLLLQHLLYRQESDAHVRGLVHSLLSL